MWYVSWHGCGIARQRHPGCNGWAGGLAFDIVVLLLLEEERVVLLVDRPLGGEGDQELKVLLPVECWAPRSIGSEMWSRRLRAGFVSRSPRCPGWQTNSVSESSLKSLTTCGICVLLALLVLLFSVSFLGLAHRRNRRHACAVSVGQGSIGGLVEDGLRCVYPR